MINIVFLSATFVAGSKGLYRNTIGNGQHYKHQHENGEWQKVILEVRSWQT